MSAAPVSAAPVIAAPVSAAPVSNATHAQSILRQDKLGVVYDPAYLCGGLPHFARIGSLVDSLTAKNAGLENSAPENAQLEWHRPIIGAAAHDLARLHEAGYVQAFLSGQMPLAQSNHLPWSPALVAGVLAMCDGQLSAASLALTRGIAFNFAFGFHHAHPERGGGFCTFNGLALVALAYPGLSVTVLDCDEHGSDGTEAFCARLPNLTNYSIFGTRFGLRGGERSKALRVPRGKNAQADFRTAVQQALADIQRAPPHLLIFQAGADSHIDDPKSSLGLSTDDLLWRDRAVFEVCRALALPVLVGFAGSYQSPEASSALYRNTILCALECRKQTHTK